MGSTAGPTVPPPLLLQLDPLVAGGSDSQTAAWPPPLHGITPSPPPPPHRPGCHILSAQRRQDPAHAAALVVASWAPATTGASSLTPGTPRAPGTPSQSQGQGLPEPGSTPGFDCQAVAQGGAKTGPGFMELRHLPPSRRYRSQFCGGRVAGPPLWVCSGGSKHGSMEAVTRDALAQQPQGRHRNGAKLNSGPHHKVSAQGSQVHKRSDLSSLA